MTRKALKASPQSEALWHEFGLVLAQVLHLFLVLAHARFRFLARLQRLSQFLRAPVHLVLNAHPDDARDKGEILLVNHDRCAIIVCRRGRLRTQLRPIAAASHRRQW